MFGIIKIQSGANERCYASLKHQYGVPGICSHDPQRHTRVEPCILICTPRFIVLELRFFLQHCRRHLAVDRKRFWQLGFTRAMPPHSSSMHMEAFYTRGILVLMLRRRYADDSN